MMEKICDLIVVEMVALNIISDNNDSKEFYKYGLELILMSLIILIPIIISAVFLNKLTECICFVLFFCPIRSIVGGYHCNDFISCFLLSIALWGILIIILSTQMIAYFFSMPIIFTIGLIHICNSTPIEHPNNPLTNEDIQLLKSKIKIIAYIHCFLAMVFFLLKKDSIVITQNYSILATLLLMIIPKMKGR